MKTLIALLGLASTLFFSGCASLESRAPLPMATNEGEMARLQQGRQIYITTCADCHVVRSVNNYTKEQWAVLLPQMQLLAEADPEHEPLSVSQLESVRRYITAVHGTK